MRTYIDLLRNSPGDPFTLFTVLQFSESQKVLYPREEEILHIYEEYRTTNLKDQNLKKVPGGELRL